MRRGVPRGAAASTSFFQAAPFLRGIGVQGSKADLFTMPCTQWRDVIAAGGYPWLGKRQDRTRESYRPDVSRKSGTCSLWPCVNTLVQRLWRRVFTSNLDLGYTHRPSPSRPHIVFFVPCAGTSIPSSVLEFYGVSMQHSRNRYRVDVTNTAARSTAK